MSSPGSQRWPIQDAKFPPPGAPTPSNGDTTGIVNQLTAVSQLLAAIQQAILAYTTVVTDVAGTANEITVSGPTGSVTLSIPSDFRLPGTINKVTLTQPATAATLTIADNKSLTVSNIVALTATDGAALGIGAGGALAAGTYLPTLTSVANVTGTTAYNCQYMRLYNTVTVSGLIGIDPTAGTTATKVGISLPIASNLAATEQLGGTGITPDSLDFAAIYADATNDRAQLEYVAPSGAAGTFSFSFTYTVI